MITAAFEIEVVREVQEVVVVDEAAVVAGPTVQCPTILLARDHTVDHDLVPLKGATVGVNMTVVGAASGPIVVAVVVEEVHRIEGVPRIEGVIPAEEIVEVVVGDQETVEAVRGAVHGHHPILPRPRQAKEHQIPWLLLGRSLLFRKINVPSLFPNSSCEQRKRTFVAISEERWAVKSKK